MDKITVGTLATGSYWSDCYPFEVVRVTPSGKTIYIRRMTEKLISGSTYDGSAEFECIPNPDGEILSVRLTNRGYKTPCGMRIYFGHARYYYDPHF